MAIDVGHSIIGQPYFWHTGPKDNRKWRCTFKGVSFDVAGPNVPRETLERLADACQRARLKRFATLARRRALDGNR